MTDAHSNPKRAGLPASDATAWQRLAAAARSAKSAAPPRDEAAPFGFSTRVVAVWRQAREEERRLALWQRVSLRTALATVTLSALAVVATARMDQREERPLLEPPAFSMPGM